VSSKSQQVNCLTEIELYQTFLNRAYRIVSLYSKEPITSNDQLSVKERFLAQTIANELRQVWIEALGHKIRKNP
jgi:hypothetical protein